MGLGGGISGLWDGPIQGFLASNQADLNLNAARTNYQRETFQADQAINMAQEKGAFDSGKTRIQGAQVTAEQKTAYANSGVDATRGTAAQVQGNTAALNELDAQMQSINAAREVWGYKMARKQAADEWQTAQATSNAAHTGAVLGGMSKFLSGALAAATG